MAYELKHYYRVKFVLVLALHGFMKEPPKDDYEEYAKKVIDLAYFFILNKIDELDGLIKRCQSAFSDKGPEINLSYLLVGKYCNLPESVI